MMEECVFCEWPQSDTLCAYFKAEDQPRGKYDSPHGEIESLAGKLADREGADGITLYFLCLSDWRGGGGVFTAATFPLNGFRSSGRMRKSERHAGAEATGMSDAPEFYHRRCHKNKCPLPGSIRAAPRIHWVNNPPKYFTLISSGWPTVNTRIAILLGPLGSHWLLICNLVRRRVMFSNFTTAWSLKPYLLINLWAKMLRCAYMNVYSEQINTQNHSTEKPG